MELYTFNKYIQKRFGRKLYKLSLDAGMTCPNRDGTLDSRGCIFCSAGGSGDFAASRNLSITEQINEGKKLVSSKLNSHSSMPSYIAYFQAYTNTYAPLERLESIYTEAANHPDVAAISIATRPDCIDSSIMELIARIHPIKPVFIELGLQTTNEQTAHYIRRGYTNDTFTQCIRLIEQYNRQFPPESSIHIVVHTIIGLPGEQLDDMIATVMYINSLPIHGIKFQLLHILKGTDLAKEYEKKSFKVLSLEEYTDILIQLLHILRKDIVIHRITGDGPKKLLVAPLWSGDKKKVLNYINNRIRKEEEKCH